MKIKGYTFNTGFYCVDCAQAAWASRDLMYPRRLTMHAITRDEHGIPQGAVDNDGNPIHPVFELDQFDICECQLFRGKCDGIMADGTIIDLKYTSC